MLLANEDMIIHTEKYVFFLKKDKTKRSPRKRLHKEKKKKKLSPSFSPFNQKWLLAQPPPTHRSTAIRLTSRAGNICLSHWACRLSSHCRAHFDRSLQYPPGPV